jgi:opacity protein-like surface antigen
MSHGGGPMFCSRLGGIHPAQIAARPDLLGSTPSGGRRGVGAAAVMLVIWLLAPSVAQGQVCVVPFNGPVLNLGVIGSSPASISSMIGAAITTANTALVLQNTAFVGSNPFGPAPDQQGGGIWVRGVGGNIDVKSSTTTFANLTSPPVPATAKITCSQTVKETFAGVQLGSDIAKYNVNEWSFHFGSTAGYLESKGSLSGGAFSFIDPASGLQAGGGSFDNITQIPFGGVYTAALNGGLFVDALLRAEYYQTSLAAAGANLFNQPIDAHGLTFSSSIVYDWQVNPSWIIEPSAELILSRIKIDPFNYVTAGADFLNASGAKATTKFIGTLQLQDITSEIAHVGLQIEPTALKSGWLIWQPFGAVSVWHEFGHNINSNYAFSPGILNLTASSTTSTFGTFAQYSFGIFGALDSTGWTAFARLDYRDGPNLQGLSGTGAIRYQFTPDIVRARAMLAKAPVYKVSAPTAAINWTGLYVGVFAGATEGTSDWNYIAGEANPYIGGYAWGGEVGYNYQINRWVIGTEVDLAKTNTTGGTGCNPFEPIPTLAHLHSPMLNATCDAWTKLIPTATGRVGYAWNLALLYVKGGAAWASHQFAATCNVNPSIFFGPCVDPAGATFIDASASTKHWGWVIGFGTEFAVNRNWSAKLEYNYTSFADHNVTASDPTNPALHTVLNVGMAISEVTLGVNFHFYPSTIY